MSLKVKEGGRGESIFKELSVLSPLTTCTTSLIAHNNDFIYSLEAWCTKCVHWGGGISSIQSVSSCSPGYLKGCPPVGLGPIPPGHVCPCLCSPCLFSHWTPACIFVSQANPLIITMKSELRTNFSQKGKDR